MEKRYVFGLLIMTYLASSCSGSGGNGIGASAKAPTAPLCNRTSYSQQVMADSPVGYWRLDDAGATAADSSNNQNVGSYVANPALNAVGVTTGDGDSAVIFNGTTQFVSIPASTLLNSGTIKTVVSWFQTTSNFVVVFNVGDTVTNTYQIWVTAAGKASLWSNNAELDGPVVNDGQWHMVAGVWDGVNATIYVDGTLANSGALIIPSTPSTLDNQIGTQCTGTGNTSCNSFLAGTIDEISVYNSALSGSRIQALYQSTSVIPCGSAAFFLGNSFTNFLARNY